MSAVNVLVKSNAVFMLTDGAVYLPDGTLVGVAPKVRQMPHLNCAVAMRGAYAALTPIVEGIAMAASTFNDLRQVIPEILKASASACAAILNSCKFGPDFEIVVAGISESGGPAAYLVPSHGRYGEPWQVIELSGLSVLPGDQVISAKVAEIAAGRSADEIDPVVDGLALMKVQREHDFCEASPCNVGGFAQLTTITAGGISTQVIHQWNDDVVGQKLAAS